MLSIFGIQVGVRYCGDAIIARVRVDGEYCYGAFCTMIGLITWVEAHRHTLLHTKTRIEPVKDESISEIAKRIQDLLNEDEPIFFEERLAA